MLFSSGCYYTYKQQQHYKESVRHIMINSTNSRQALCILSLIFTLAFQKGFSISDKKTRGFPGGAVVGSLPAGAGDTGSSPRLGGSHVPRSSWARGPQLLSLRVWSLCSATGGAAMVRGPRTAMESGPHLPQLERALAQKRRPNTVINK